jgi:hypothetical protein
MEPILQDILHDPFGLHHPYEQEPFERTPRTPQQDQEISIGVVSWPVGAAERVWLEWSIDGEAGAPSQVVHAENPTVTQNAIIGSWSCRALKMDSR